MNWQSPSIAVRAALVVVAWAGMTIHDVYELPAIIPLGPEFTIPSLIYFVLGFAWVARPAGRLRVIFATWLVLNFIGGAFLSVLPLPFLPFEPEQTVAHYATHMIYGLAQLSALWLMRGAGKSDPS
ncbi:MAG: hypothetical protein ABI573_06400 [Chloroflexota bacterium]